MFDVQNVTLHYGARAILKEVSFKVEDAQRAAIIGPNGMGKSTLLKVVAGVLRPETGSITYPKKSEIGYLPQDLEVATDITVEAECKKVYEEVFAHEAEMRALEEKMAVVPHDTPEYDAIADRYEYLMHELERRDVYTMDAQIGRVLDGLGFRPKDLQRKCHEFSGGWQMRIALAKLLLQNPDILLLDEPTNHLDIETIEWLGEWISGHEGSVLMVSHERSFMDRLVTRVIEVDRGNAIVYRGNYTDSLAQREERREMQRRAFKNQQAEVAHVQKFIDRFRAQASKATLVQSRIRQLEKIEMIEEPEEDLGTISFRFPSAPRCGKEVLIAEGIDKTFGSNCVLQGLGMTLYRGEKIALTGRNGAGKTTFMRILANRLAADAGKVALGSNVEMAYFAQYDREDLHPDNTVLDEFLSSAPLEVSPMARSILGAFLFRGDDIEKKIAMLSGGERTRLRLAKMLCGKANLLLMDEPTNHLDIGSRLTLEQALKQYEGAVLLVSHDRYFLDAVTTRVVEIDHAHLTSFPGTYSEYLERKAALAAAAAGEQALRKASAKKAAPSRDPNLEVAKATVPTQAAAAPADPKDERQRRQQQHRDLSKKLSRAKQKLNDCEKKLGDLEAQHTRLGDEMHDPKNASDHKKLAELAKRATEAKETAKRIEEEWLAAQVEVDELESAMAELD